MSPMADDMYIKILNLLLMRHFQISNVKLDDVVSVCACWEGRCGVHELKKIILDIIQVNLTS